jgi:hypothetical protein
LTLYDSCETWLCIARLCVCQAIMT